MFHNLINATISFFKKDFGLKELLYSYLKKILFIILILFGFVLMDLFLMRGFYITEIIYVNKGDDVLGEVDFEYLIYETPEGWNFNLKNNSFNFYYFLTYRNNEEIISIPDSIFLYSFARRSKFISDSIEFKQPSGFDCGTGLGPVVIFPYEEYSHKFDNIYDLIPAYNLSYIYRYFSDLDSINLQFFIPIYKIGSKQPIDIYSNSLSIDYQKMIEILEMRIEEYPYLSPPGSIF